MTKEKEVVQKIIAASGLCSRRAAEELLRTGKVKVNGYTAKAGDRAELDDEITVNGKPLKKVQALTYIMVNKPVGYVCTNRKFPGERNVFELIKSTDRLTVVGRLDKASRGLVLLTNDGALANKLTHPSFEVEKTYLVETDKFIDKETSKKIINKIREGVDVGEGDGLGWATSAIYEDGTFEIGLTQGLKRQIRRMFTKLGYEVKDLERIAIGPLHMGGLPQGEWRKLDPLEVKALKELDSE